MAEKVTRPEDKASAHVLKRIANEDIKTVWERFDLQQPQCGFGRIGFCCKNCNLGPCRIDPFGDEPKYGVCGADGDIIAARNMVRHAAAGSSCHSDHGREMAMTLLLAARGQAEGYQIKDVVKLNKLAAELGIATDGKGKEKVAEEVALKLLSQFGQQEGEILFGKRAPKKQQENWRNLDVYPRGIDREVVEAMARTNMGVDNDHQNLVEAAMKVGLADGWGGSMIGTEISDVLFGSPQPIRSKANLGVLQNDHVNIVIHGHVPLLSDVIVTASQDPELLALAKEKGADGITVAGICCTANEMLVRRGVPVAGNLLQQELAIATGAVEAMVVDIQCVMPGLNEVASCFHTKLISTHPKAKFPGMTHIEFEEKEAYSIAKKIVKEAVDNFPNRDKKRVDIPKETMDLIAGFTTENTFYHLGGKFRPTYRPLNDAIMAGRIRGVVGVVGCDNPKNMSGGAHIVLVKELIKKDILVVQTGCSAIACAKEGLLQPESAFKYAGRGLQEVCEAVGIPPVLHLGSCVDNSRILTACAEMVKEGGIGTDFSELPVAGCAPEWMSEKAIAIGWYVVASGVLCVFGTPMPISGSKNLDKYLTEDIEKIVGGKWAFESDPKKMAEIIIDHINKKREALKLEPMMYEDQLAEAAG
ncbi:MAG: anaerobic carbon-monoxide dehydrogenase catalytic subunit [Candidatus Tectomicrobia bacterium]|uniref:Carbon monoxide dehydrogenase n=1 Tax=Tectimicrobiota bacterium TaxID=2528274 RepID=A0A933GLI2_UNCTE|nr:anaerobic carbon-monoxide dehydrogenase catalytic subunit [Candidatus Tectomicrobia bacterium]